MLRKIQTSRLATGHVLEINRHVIAAFVVEMTSHITKCEFSLSVAILDALQNEDRPDGNFC
jgi:hypothetical protein